MKVLIIAPVPLDGNNTHFGGGVSFSYIGIIKLLESKGHEVRYLSPWHNLEPMFFKYYPGFREISFSHSNRKKIEEQMAWADKVLLPDSTISSFVLKTAKKLKTPVVLCNHTDCFKLISTTFTNRSGLVIAAITRMVLFPFYKIKLRLLSKGASLYLTTTRENKKTITKMGIRVDGLFDNIGPKTLIFGEHDSEDEIKEIRSDLLRGTHFKKIILFAGRIAEEKRIPLLFEARPDNALLVIVGDGPIAEKIMSFHNPEKGIVFINKMLPQDRLRKLIKATDLSVSASDFETLGMSVYETWLCGNKSVVQNDGGFKDQIRDLSHGKLIDFKKSKEARQAIEEVLLDDTPLATVPALPIEKSIEVYLKEATKVPSLSKLSEWFFAWTDSIVLLFASYRDDGNKSDRFISALKHGDLTQS
jgi:glycosyltransferase involved in cell wall biosynthesis